MDSNFSHIFSCVSCKRGIFRCVGTRYNSCCWFLDRLSVFNVAERLDARNFKTPIIESQDQEVALSCFAPALGQIIPTLQMRRGVLRNPRLRTVPIMV